MVCRHIGNKNIITVLLEFMLTVGTSLVCQQELHEAPLIFGSWGHRLEPPLVRPPPPRPLAADFLTCGQPRLRHVSQCLRVRLLLSALSALVPPSVSSASVARQEGPGAAERVEPRRLRHVLTPTRTGREEGPRGAVQVHQNHLQDVVLQR
ncbi:hypothetical protein NDU88_008602 [Pleurodeles waltl]|uniref:Secreted protein n=1 Tax=Pleurodeles waltl TaxID=8319 RepID=A0AAV7PSL2_PLEWA|nr:hypothetical protein NDU88_008602 [Pleurodeles waltl]